MAMAMTTLSRPRPFALLLLATFTSFVAACGSDETTSPTNEFGHYTLVSVNGQAVPFTLTGTPRGTVVVQSGSMDLSGPTTTSAGKSVYVATLSGTAAGQSQQLVADAGTYTVSGTTITFTSALPVVGTYTGVMNGNALTVSVPGLALGIAGTITLVVQR